MNEDQIDGIAQQAWDNSKPAPAFRPYTQKAAKTGKWLAKNALPIAGIILAVIA